MNHKLRCESVRHCRWVDEVLADAPWVLTDDYLTLHSIDFVAHDAIPYKDTSGSASNSGDVYHHIKQKGMFLETQRTDGLSTSDIIVTIIREYDDYVLRSLDRGYSKEELNVGKSWQVRARFHEKQKEFRQSLEQLKVEQKRAEGAAMAFIREFNPKYHMRRTRSHESIANMTQEPMNGQGGGDDEGEDDKVDWSPKAYVSRLKETLPVRSAGLFHHSAGLAWAIVETTGYFLSYLNPLSYFQSHKKKH
jgi:glycerol-3-phosphate cytidylyltransferase-like family protein